MARAQFDREDVLDKTIDLFWEYGFSAASMKKIVQKTGLKPGSIYLAFGNKEGLYLESLQRYADLTVDCIKVYLDRGKSVLQGICNFFDWLIQQTTQEGYCSCFLVKSQLELGDEQKELHQFASDKLLEIEALFTSYLEREFNTDLSRERAICIMLHMFGIRVYGYHQGSAAKMRRGLRRGLPWLPWT